MPRRTRSTSTNPLCPATNVVTLSTPSHGLTTQLFDSASSWENWLEENYKMNTGIWLRLSKKDSGATSISYDEALDVALCFGWIDGQRKRHDAQYFIQRFTPRRKTSIWSKRNVNKVALLIESGRMRQSGLAEIDAAKADGRWDRAYSSSSNAQVPDDFKKALDINKDASEFFDTINRTQRYSFLQRIETAKRPDTRKRRIAQFVELLANQQCL
ncbi:hypothetical protein G7046_g1994 [Stylonectria norvegica]|nr:hypothetical protein G7046_g1994 [Stylonectria norvegica]